MLENKQNNNTADLGVVLRVHDVHPVSQCSETAGGRQQFAVAQVERDAATVHIEPGKDLSDSGVRVENDLYRWGSRKSAGEYRH